MRTTVAIDDELFASIRAGKPINENLYEWSPEKLKRAGIGILPQNLKEALDEFEKDKVLRSALEVDRLTAAALEKAAIVRHTRIPT